jgi:hypothetical protein
MINGESGQVHVHVPDISGLGRCFHPRVDALSQFHLLSYYFHSKRKNLKTVKSIYPKSKASTQLENYDFHGAAEPHKPEGWSMPAFE